MMSRISSLQLRHPCGRIVAGDGWGRSRDNSLNLRDHELWFVWQGRGWMQTQHRRFDLRPGFCAWMRPGGIYDAGLTGPGLGFTYLHFTCAVESPPEFFQLEDVGFFDTLTRRIAEQIDPVPVAHWGEPAATSPATTTLLEAALLDLLDQPDHGQRSAASHPHQAAIQELAAAMRNEPGRTYRISAAAQQLGLSVSHFSRQFHLAMGVGPRDYLVRCRLDRARHLLRESNLSVTRIAEALGYTDVFFFSKHFTRHIGLSPTRYRRGAAAPQ